MSSIKLTFSPEMAFAALTGRKCCTTRDEIKGRAGDEFEIGGVRFRILDVLANLPIRIVCSEFYRLEGFDCVDDCAAALQTIYPDLNQYDALNVHFFARCQ